MWVWSLIWEDPTGLGATKSMCHKCWTCSLEPGSCSYWGPCTLQLVAGSKRSRSPQERVAPTHCNEIKAFVHQWRPSATKKWTNILYIYIYIIYIYFLNHKGISLAVQWLRLQASNAGGVQVRSLVRELRSHTPCEVAKKKIFFNR